MDFLISMDSSAWTVILSALAAAVSFAAVAIPLLQRKEKQERYKEVIEKKRRALFEQAREAVNNPKVKKDEQQISAAKSIAITYKIQALAGDASAKARNLCQRAGVRNPMAPIYYLMARMLLPLLLLSISLLFLHKMEKPPSEMVKIMLVLGPPLAGFFLPYLLLKNNADKRQQEISLAFPDSLDMLLICVQGGIGIEAAINRIAGTVSGHSVALAEELGILCAELGMLNDRKGAFMGFSARVGSGPARSFATAMLQAEQYGTSIAKALRTLAEETRSIRMAMAEQKAASLPPKLTVPMILFFMPALFVCILSPAFMKIPD